MTAIDMTEIEAAEATIKNLEDQRQALCQRNIEITDEWKTLQFQRDHNGDQNVQSRMDEINAEQASQAVENVNLS